MTFPGKHGRPLDESKGQSGDGEISNGKAIEGYKERPQSRDNLGPRGFTSMVILVRPGSKGTPGPTLSKRNTPEIKEPAISKAELLSLDTIPVIICMIEHYQTYSSLCRPTTEDCRKKKKQFQDQCSDEWIKKD